MSRAYYEELVPSVNPVLWPRVMAYGEAALAPAVAVIAADPSTLDNGG